MTDAWTNIPTDLLDGEKAAQTAADWAAQQRGRLAQTWADTQRGMLGALSQGWQAVNTATDQASQSIANATQPSQDLAQSVAQGTAQALPTLDQAAGQAGQALGGVNQMLQAPFSALERQAGIQLPTAQQVGQGINTATNAVRYAAQNPQAALNDISQIPAELQAQDQNYLRSRGYSEQYIQTGRPATDQDVQLATEDASKAVLSTSGGEIDALGKKVPQLGAGLLGKAGQAVSRFFHGTGSAFDSPDAAKFDSNGLFGPGYYLTTSPEVAGGVADNFGNLLSQGYAFARQESPVRVQGFINTQRASVDRLQNEVEQWPANSSQRAYFQQRLAEAQAKLDAMLSPEAGPNVRAVNVPKGLNLLDADANLTATQMQQLIGGLSEKLGTPLDNLTNLAERQSQAGTPIEFGNYYSNILRESGASSADVNQALQALGYDGITYAGGKRIPLMDEAGNPIEHTAVVIFPESLPKITNALSGRPMGSPPRVGGAILGGYLGYNQDPNATPEQRARNALLGAGLGYGVGYGAERAGEALGRPMSAAERNLADVNAGIGGNGGAAPPRPTPPAPTLSAGTRTLLDMYADKPTGPAPSLSQRVQNITNGFVRAMTDRGVDLSQFQQSVEKAIGRPLNADEMASELSRLNPDKAAQVTLQQTLRPALQQVGPEDQKYLSAYLTAMHNTDVAAALGKANRKFSGGLTAADSPVILQDIENAVGPARYSAIQDAAQQVWKLSDQLRQRAVDSGLWTPQLAADLRAKYPHYVPTKILDYMQEPYAIPQGKSLSVRDQGLKQLTEAGTEREREDPLASMVRATYQMEGLARKNDAFNAFVKLNDLLPAAQRVMRQVPDSYTATAREAKVTGFLGGKRVTYVMPKEYEALVKAAPTTSVPLWNNLMGAYKMLLTSRNPAFLAGNAFNDAVQYTIRELGRSGGNPIQLPKIWSMLAQAYGDAFKGILSDTYTGADTARFLQGGGGQFGIFKGSPADARASVAELARPNVLTVNGAGDLKRIIGDIATFKPVEGVGERIELAPRVASMKLAEQRGANPVQAVINGRTVTIDFAQGGNAAKVLDGFVPFFNVGMQAMATPVRAFRENPRGMTLAALGTLVAPTIGAELWNHADPQRAKDYADVPNYIKDQGVVVMLPGQAPTDNQGERRPPYVLIKTREFSPITNLARGIIEHVVGDNPEGWGQLVSGTLNTISPVQANSLAGAAGSFVPPGGDTVRQLGVNRDFFRGSTIANQYNDRAASALSTGIASGLNQIPGANVRPSQVEFGIQDTLGGPGQVARDLSNVVAGKPSSGMPQDLPLAGSFIRRFVGNSVGQDLQTAQDERLTPDAQKVIRDAGLQAVTPVQGQINGLPLSRTEQASYQQLVNRSLNRMVVAMGRNANYQKLPQADKAKLLQSMMDDIRAAAAQQVLPTIDQAALRERVRAGLRDGSLKP